MIDSDLNLPLEAIRDLCRRHHISELALFGSAVTDNFTLRSDVDLLVEFEPETHVGFMTLAKIQREFSELLERRVDLVPKGGLKPKIKEAVLSSARILYAA
ncbi:MAG: nucleotidyltransferase [Acidobacteria bacterium]|nr:MAG: nucleotidyltransferase [Acidobacteriota bacterium]